MNDNNNTNRNTQKPYFPAPVGDGLNLATMRQLAMQLGAQSFTDVIMTKTDDVGYLLNSTDAPYQYGVSTYERGDILVTNSIITYMPNSGQLIKMFGNYGENNSSMHNEASAACAYTDVVDITTPYQLPHVIVAPRMVRGFAGMFSTAVSMGMPNIVTVQLEGDFSDFVSVAVVKGDDPSAFLVMAPNLMDRILRDGTNFILEFVGNHIYLYWREDKAQTIDVNAGYNTDITLARHKKVLQLGMDIVDLVVRSARPANNSTSTPTRMKVNPWLAILFSFYPFLIGMAGIALLVNLLLAPLPSGNSISTVGRAAGLLLIVVAVGILAVRYRKSQKLWRDYVAKYGDPDK